MYLNLRKQPSQSSLLQRHAGKLKRQVAKQLKCTVLEDPGGTKMSTDYCHNCWQYQQIVKLLGSSVRNQNVLQTWSRLVALRVSPVIGSISVPASPRSQVTARLQKPLKPASARTQHNSYAYAPWQPLTNVTPQSCSSIR